MSTVAEKAAAKKAAAKKVAAEKAAAKKAAAKKAAAEKAAAEKTGELKAPNEKDCLKIEDLGDRIKYVTKAGQKIIIPKK